MPLKAREVVHPLCSYFPGKANFSESSLLALSNAGLRGWDSAGKMKLSSFLFVCGILRFFVLLQFLKRTKELSQRCLVCDYLPNYWSSWGD